MVMHNLIVLDAQTEKMEYIHVQESKVNKKKILELIQSDPHQATDTKVKDRQIR